MPESINPLRYPGAKRSLVNYVDALIQANNLQGCCFYEPYAGSAVVGLELLQRGIIDHLVLCEKDILIYALWSCIFNQTDDLCNRIHDTPVTIETWLAMEPYRQVTLIGEYPLLELGFAGLFFNRTNFSGILKANPIGGLNQTSKYTIDCRFNREKIIDIIQGLSRYRNHVEVHCGDALEFMRQQQNHFRQTHCFAYFDPPYYKKGSKIYRHYYRNQDHIDLCDYVSQVHNLDWLISYDDAPFICALYGETGAQYRPFFLDYSCAASTVRTHGEELLISNLRLPPFPLANAIAL